MATIYYAHEFYGSDSQTGAVGTSCLCSVMSRTSARIPKEWSDSVNRDRDCELLYPQARCTGWNDSEAGLSRDYQLSVSLSGLGILLAWLPQDFSRGSGLQSECSSKMLPITPALCLLYSVVEAITNLLTAKEERQRQIPPLNLLKKFRAMFQNCLRNLLTAEAHWQLSKLRNPH